MVLGLETAHMLPFGQNLHISAQIQKSPRKSVFRIVARKLEICRYSEDGVLRPGTKDKRTSPKAPSEKCKVNWHAHFLSLTGPRRSGSPLDVAGKMAIFIIQSSQTGAWALCTLSDLEAAAKRVTPDSATSCEIASAVALGCLGRCITNL